MDCHTHHLKPAASLSIIPPRVASGGRTSEPYHHHHLGMLGCQWAVIVLEQSVNTFNKWGWFEVTNLTRRCCDVISNIESLANSYTQSQLSSWKMSSPQPSRNAVFFSNWILTLLRNSGIYYLALIWSPRANTDFKRRDGCSAWQETMKAMGDS